jgi:hypothetical protein
MPFEIHRFTPAASVDPKNVLEGKCSLEVQQGEMDICQAVEAFYEQ